MGLLLCHRLRDQLGTGFGGFAVEVDTAFLVDHCQLQIAVELAEDANNATFAVRRGSVE